VPPISPPATDDVHRLALELPVRSEPVNVHIVLDEPLTLVDTGPNREQALASLETALAAHGRRVEDVGRVILTHQHFDHIGLASEIHRRSGAEVWAHPLLVPWLAEEPLHFRLDLDFTTELMLANGVPEEVIAPMLEAEQEKLSWDPSVTVTHELREGEEVESANRRWRVVHAPGHSPFDTLLLDEARGELFSGDHLLPNISPNPIMTTAPNLPAETPHRAMRAFRASLARSRRLDAEVVHPGHGQRFSGHREAIDFRFAEMAERQRQIAAVIAARPRTPHEVAREIWPQAAIALPHLTLYEVLGHVDLLVEAGEVAKNPDGGVTRLVATP
jgi:glyoxylase-like metal-dependent hydrolase (beta-lactamase superfamily II)